MKIHIYGPMPDGLAITEILKRLPADANEVIIQAPPRRAIDLKACQRPGCLEYSASVDSKLFIHLSQVSPTAPYEVKTS